MRMYSLLCLSSPSMFTVMLHQFEKFATSSNKEAEAADLEQLLEGPAMEPPVGSTPSFEYQGECYNVPHIMAILAAVTITACVIARLLARWVLREIRLSDYLLVLSLVCDVLYHLRC